MRALLHSRLKHRSHKEQSRRQTLVVESGGFNTETLSSSLRVGRPIIEPVDELFNVRSILPPKLILKKASIHPDRFSLCFDSLSEPIDLLDNHLIHRH